MDMVVSWIDRCHLTSLRMRAGVSLAGVISIKRGLPVGLQRRQWVIRGKRVERAKDRLGRR